MKTSADENLHGKIVFILFFERLEALLPASQESKHLICRSAYKT